MGTENDEAGQDSQEEEQEVKEGSKPGFLIHNEKLYLDAETIIEHMRNGAYVRTLELRDCVPDSVAHHTKTGEIRAIANMAMWVYCLIAGELEARNSNDGE